MDPSVAVGLELWGKVWGFNFAIICLSTLANTPNRPDDDPMKYVPFFLSLATLATPFTLEASNVEFRAALSLGVCFYCLKIYESTTEKRFADAPLWKRIANFGATFTDVDASSPAAPLWGPRIWEILVLALHCALDLMGVLASAFAVQRGVGVLDADEDRDVAAFSLVERLGVLQLTAMCGCWYAFFSLKLFGRFLQLLWVVLAGLRLDELMKSVERSRNLREFWGKRWDCAIQGLLQKFVYTPLRARGASRSIAIATTFLASGVLHVVPIAVGLPREAKLHAVLMFGYFVVQLALMFVEQRIVSKLRLGRAAMDVWIASCTFGPALMLFVPVRKLMGHTTVFVVDR